VKEASDGSRGKKGKIFPITSEESGKTKVGSEGKKTLVPIAGVGSEKSLVKVHQNGEKPVKHPFLQGTADSVDHGRGKRGHLALVPSESEGTRQE